jgi:hypothetical protein
VSELYREQIEKLILDKGPQGVNAISRALDIPLSTAQKHMEKQRFFVKNDQRKWDVPSNAMEVEVAKAQGNFADVIDSQLAGLDSLLELLSSNLRSVVTLLKSNRPTAPVVSRSKLNPVLEKMAEQVEYIEKTIKEYEKKIPKEYKELFINLDLYAFHTQEGFRYIREVFGPQFSEMLLSEVALTDELIGVLEQYQYE